MTDITADVEKLWQQIYASFEKRPFDAVRTALNMKNTANQVQFKLLKNIAQLKTQPTNETLHGDIRADIMLAATIGFISQSEAEKAQKQLDFIADKGNK